jgi:hypothetical protein
LRTVHLFHSVHIECAYITHETVRLVQDFVRDPVHLPELHLDICSMMQDVFTRCNELSLFLKHLPVRSTDTLCVTLPTHDVGLDSLRNALLPLLRRTRTLVVQAHGRLHSDELVPWCLALAGSDVTCLRLRFTTVGAGFQSKIHEALRAQAIRFELDVSVRVMYGPFRMPPVLACT